jgi:hypothetical protein
VDKPEKVSLSAVAGKVEPCRRLNQCTKLRECDMLQHAFEIVRTNKELFEVVGLTIRLCALSRRVRSGIAG